MVGSRCVVLCVIGSMCALVLRVWPYVFGSMCVFLCIVWFYVLCGSICVFGSMVLVL